MVAAVLYPGNGMRAGAAQPLGPVLMPRRLWLTMIRLVNIVGHHLPFSLSKLQIFTYPCLSHGPQVILLLLQLAPS